MTIIETERLVLRRLVIADLAPLYQLYSDPEMRRFFPEGVRTLEETKKEMEWHMNGHPEDPNLGLWAMELKEDGRFVGRSGLIPWTIDGVRLVEVAYMVAKPYWRQGLGSEVAAALVTYGFERLGLETIIALIDPEHTASVRTAQRAGLRFERQVVMDGVSSAVYSISRDPAPIL